MLQTLNRDGTNMDFRLAVALGLVNGANRVTIVGAALDMPIISSTIMLWEAQSAYPWQTSAQSLEILSSSATDSAAGTGARTATIKSLDGNYVEQITVVTLNGTTPVALPGTHQFINGMQISSSGTGHTNAGNITLRVAGAGATLGFIAATFGVAHAYQYTVPAGKLLVIDNFYLDNISLANKTATSEIYLCTRLADGTVLINQINMTDSGDTPNNITLATPVVALAKTTIFMQIDYTDQTGVSIEASSVGMLLTV
jgi:hypothetical protein